MAANWGAILAGLGGGLSGYASQEQRKRDELDRNRQRALSEALNAAGLMNEGWESPEAFARRQEQVKGNAAGAAQSMARFAATRGAGGAVTPDQMADVARAPQIARGPVGQVRIGQQDLVLPESGDQRARLAAALEEAGKMRQTQQQQSFVRGERLAEQQAQAERDKANQAFQLERDKIRAEAIRTAAQTRADAAEGKPPVRPSEGQARAYAFAETMSKANDVIREFGPRANLDKITAVLRLEGAAATAAMNRTLTPEEQMLATAIRQFAEPILRIRTGAAFGDKEVQWIAQQVVPLSGDSEQVQRYKTESRDLELESMRMIASPAYRYYDWIQGQNAPTGRGGAGRGTSVPDLTSLYDLEP